MRRHFNVCDRVSGRPSQPGALYISEDELEFLIFRPRPAGCGISSVSHTHRFCRAEEGTRTVCDRQASYPPSCTPASSRTALSALKQGASFSTKFALILPPVFPDVNRPLPPLLHQGARGHLAVLACHLSQL